MPNSFLSINKSTTKTLNLFEFKNFFLDDISNKNTKNTLTINVKKNQGLNIYCYIVNSSKKKEITFNINQLENSTVNIYVKAFAFSESFTKVIINSNLKKNAVNTMLNQEINGFIFDDDSTIIATPSMNIDNNKIKANHSVNIGSVDPEKLFYLQSRGIQQKQALLMLLKSEYDYLDKIQTKESKTMYKNINDKIIKNYQYEV